MTVPDLGLLSQNARPAKREEFDARAASRLGAAQAAMTTGAERQQGGAEINFEEEWCTRLDQGLRHIFQVQHAEGMPWKENEREQQRQLFPAEASVTSLAMSKQSDDSSDEDSGRFRRGSSIGTQAHPARSTGHDAIYRHTSPRTPELEVEGGHQRQVVNLPVHMLHNQHRDDPQPQPQQQEQEQELERRVAEMALALERSRQELLRAQAELEPEPEPEPEPVAHQCAGCSLVVPRERFSDAQWAKRPQSRCRVCISSGVPVRAKLAPDTAPDTERKHSQREHSTMQDLLLALARENSELRYEDGADVPVSLDLSGDGSVELCVGGQPWQPRTANGADETESCIGLGVLQTGAMPDDSTTPYEMTPYDRAQASSGRGRRGEAARKEARRLEELEVQVTLAQKSKCVLCGHPPPVPGAPKPAAKMKMGGLPRFG